MTTGTRTALGRAHTSAKAADVTKLLQLYKHRVTHTESHAEYNGRCPYVSATHSLANKTLQLRPKSTTGSSFYWSISGTFVGGYDPSPKNFYVSRFCMSCLCPLCLLLVCFATEMISLVQIPVHRCYTGNTVRLEGYGTGMVVIG